MFLEYLNYVVHFLQIDQERKTQKIAHKQKQDNQRSMQLRYIFLKPVQDNSQFSITLPLIFYH